MRYLLVALALSWPLAAQVTPPSGGGGAKAGTCAAGQFISGTSNSAPPTCGTPAGSGANTALSNLAAVAINTSLLPGVDNSIALGNGSFRFTGAYFPKLPLLTSNGFVKTSGGDGTLSVDTTAYPSGSGTSGQLALWNGTSTQTGNAGFTWTGDGSSTTKLVVTGGAGAGILHLAGAGTGEVWLGTANGFSVRRNSVAAFEVSADSTVGTPSQRLITTSATGTTTLSSIGSLPQLHVVGYTGTSAPTDSGGYMASLASDAVTLSAGAAYDGAAWRAKTAGATLLDQVAGTYVFYGDTGLTPGNTFSPTARMSLSAAGVLNLSGLTASQAVATDGSKNLVSVATTGTGNYVLQTSPTITTPTISAASSAAGVALTRTATAPAQITTAQAGVGASVTASDAVAGSSVAGAAAGGPATLQAGNAARLTSGNADGGHIYLLTGTGVGSGVAGCVQGLPAAGTNECVRFTPGGNIAMSWSANLSGNAVGALGDGSNSVAINVASANGYGISSSSTNPSVSNADVIWRRKAAGTPAWGLASATPVAYTHVLSGEGSGTDIAGAAASVHAGIGTGTGASGDFKVQSAYAGSTGSSANTLTDRQHIESAWTTLTETTATAFATLTHSASTSIGAEFLVTVQANDATDFQSLTSRVRVSSVRKSTGNTVSAIGVVGTNLVAESAGGSTLTCTFTTTDGASAVTVNADCTSSLTQSTLRLSFQAAANGPVTIAGL